MQIHVGTSGFGYKEWKGKFYPDDLSSDAYLSFYAQHFAVVEINNTFYRLPDEGMLTKWVSQVPEAFTFVIKASRRITHTGRLADTDDTLAALWKRLEPLGPRRGPVLFQTPPNFRRDLPRLEAFLEKLPAGCEAAFEFRHPSWHDEETAALLRQREAVLVTAQGERPGPTPAIVPTAGWGYLRLHRFEYSDAELATWAREITAQPWQRAFVFFKHEDEARGPALAKKFLSLLAETSSTPQ